MANPFLGPSMVLETARALWPTALIEIDPSPGYDIGQDLAWQMRLWVSYEGKRQVCYLSTLDLTLSLDNFRRLLDGSKKAA